MPSIVVRNDLVNHYGIAHSKIEVVPPFVRDEQICAERGVRLPVAGRPFTIGGAGTPTWVKGTLLWLQTAVELRKLVNPAQLRFMWTGIRDDFDTNCFRKMSEKLGLGSVVEFLTETADFLRHFEQFDVLALTSWEESASLATLHAMMLGKPVVFFQGSGGPAELVGAGDTAVKEFCPQAMALTIAELVNSQETVEHLGRENRRRVQEYFLASQHIPRLLKLMQQCVDSR